MFTTLTYVIVGILIAEYAMFLWLEKLNLSMQKKPLPPKLEGIYDPEEYQRSRAYKNTNTRFSFITESFSLITILAFLLFGGFPWLNNIVNSHTENPLVASLLFFAIVFFVSDIIQIPFSLYAIFVIEQKFGFNKTTPKLFVFDKLKSWLITLILGGIILSGIIWFYQTLGSNFWIYAWALISGFSLFMFMFYSNLIVPLFNKQTPLEAGNLRLAIEQFSSKAGFQLSNIFVIDGSKRSTKANAYFTGLGPKKRIVLYDTLIEKLSVEEIVAVLAHEIGHYKHKHTTGSLAISILQTGLMLFLLSIFIFRPEPAAALGVSEPNFHVGMIAFGLLYSPFEMIIGLIMNMLSRKNEYQADAFASSFGLGEMLISSLKKLSITSLSNLTPHPTYVFFHYSHPSLLQRMEAIEQHTKISAAA